MNQNNYKERIKEMSKQQQEQQQTKINLIIEDWNK